MKSGPGAFSISVKNRYGTVWTDPGVVAMTIEETLKYYTEDLHSATFCDPACGDGNFLVSIYRLLTKFPTKYETCTQSEYILSRIYGVDIIDRMVAAARSRL